MSLDRQKPFGTIHGDEQGQHYAQDGKTFGADGEPWVPPKSEAQVDAEKQSAFDAAVEAAVAERLKKLAVKAPPAKAAAAG